MRTAAIFAALVLFGQAQKPVIRSGVNLVVTDVIVRDDKGQFVSNLGRNDFDLFEDGVKQNLVMFVLTHGGRVFNDTGAPPAASPEGLLLPPARPPGDISGRMFLIFIDDLHMDFHATSRVRNLLTKISTELIHDGDLFGVVSTGTSSIATEMTYDRKRLDEAIKKVMGGGLPPAEIIGAPEGSQGPPEVRHRVHVAMSTAYDILQNLEQVHDRRKAFIYISEGYDFDPYSRSRSKAAAERTPPGDSGQIPDANPFSKTGNEFAAADLAAELSELTRQANRANTTIFTIDPRGLEAGPDLSQPALDSTDWQDHVRETQSSLRVLADLTGGVAAIASNDYTRALKRIDSLTSDYYLVGYYSSNPDPLKKRRAIEIRIKPAAARRTDRWQLSYKTSYTLKPPK
jgi:VWFA-related protein